MADEFKVIETQEQLDAVLKGRLERERGKFESQIADLEKKLSSQSEELQKQIGDLTSALNTAKEEKETFNTTLAEKDAQIKKYELHSVKTQIAHELGLSFEAVDFLRGEDAEEIRKSAETLKNMVGARTMPLASNEPPANTLDSAFMALSQQLQK